jgi:tripartite tricarboxylate transporter TctB family protein
VSASARDNVDGGVAVNQVAHAAEPAPASREPIAWLAGLAARLPSPAAAAVRFFNTEASVYFAWLLAFLLSIWLIGFLPAIATFVFAYMCLGFREPVLHSAGFAAVTVLLCWGLFDRTLAVAWPASLLGDLSPQLRAMVGFI